MGSKGSSSSSTKKTINTTNVKTVTKTIVAGRDVFNIGRGGKNKFNIGITGDDAVRAIASFNSGIARVEELQTQQQTALLNTFSTLNTARSIGSPSAPIFSKGETGSKGSPQNFGKLIATVAAIGGVMFFITQVK